MKKNTLLLFAEGCSSLLCNMLECGKIVGVIGGIDDDDEEDDDGTIVFAVAPAGVKILVDGLIDECKKLFDIFKFLLE